MLNVLLSKICINILQVLLALLVDLYRIILCSFLSLDISIITASPSWSGYLLIFDIFHVCLCNWFFIILNLSLIQSILHIVSIKWLHYLVSPLSLLIVIHHELLISLQNLLVGHLVYTHIHSLINTLWKLHVEIVLSCLMKRRNLIASCSL